MTHDYLIIGAGPAGLQLAALLERDGHDYAVLERGTAPGTFFIRYPRHRQLISIKKVYTGFDDPELNLRMDWNSLLSDDGRPVSPDIDGEMFVRTPAQAAEYWADPRQFAEVFVDGRVRTRDVGHIDAEGHLHLVGRTRDVIVVNANLPLRRADRAGADGASRRRRVAHGRCARRGDRGSGPRLSSYPRRDSRRTVRRCG